MTTMRFEMRNMTKVRLDILDHARLSGLKFLTYSERESYVSEMIKKMEGLYGPLRTELNNLEVCDASQSNS